MSTNIFMHCFDIASGTTKTHSFFFKRRNTYRRKKVAMTVFFVRLLFRTHMHTENIRTSSVSRVKVGLDSRRREVTVFSIFTVVSF